MKVLMVYGGPHRDGCTHAALNEMRKVFEEQGVQAEDFWLGTRPIGGCLSCRKCAELGKCVMDDKVNEFLEKAPEYDGFVFASPVHFSGVAGAMTAFLDRVFFVVSNADLDFLRLKPAATLVSARRAGTTAALEQLNQFVQYNSMIQVTSDYWNMVHGSTPEDVAEDLEGLQIMRILATNMVYVLRLIESGRENGVKKPEKEVRVWTNFIR